MEAAADDVKQRRAARAPALLAIDTATEHMSIALSWQAREWHHEAPGGARASAGLIPAIRSLLQQAGAELSELDAIAFGRGPGAFTGLRTACAVAQGLSFGSGKPVLPLDTLMLVAEDARLDAGVTDVWVAMDARMQEAYAARYGWRDGRWTVWQAPALYTVEALAARWTHEPPAAVAGTALEAFGDRLPLGSAERVAQALPRARSLIAVARAAWDDGHAVDAAHALPLYLRDKVALTTAEREAAKAARAVAGGIA
jgi:tRNA threonylcarbamoyladenosine biosynthesis protein TsaB